MDIIISGQDAQRYKNALEKILPKVNDEEVKSVLENLFYKLGSTVIEKKFTGSLREDLKRWC